MSFVILNVNAITFFQEVKIKVKNKNCLFPSLKTEIFEQSTIITATVTTVSNGVRRRRTRDATTSIPEWNFRRVTGHRLRMMTASTSTSPRHTRLQCVRNECDAPQNHLH